MGEELKRTHLIEPKHVDRRLHDAGSLILIAAFGAPHGMPDPFCLQCGEQPACPSPKRPWCKIRPVGESSVDAPRAADSAFEHVRDLWTLYGPQATCTAAIYRSESGLQLRISLGGELTHQQLSRFGEQPLIMRADRVRAELLEQGWFERPPNQATSHSSD